MDIIIFTEKTFQLSFLIGLSCSLYVSTFKDKHMSVFDRKRQVEIGV